MGIGPFDNQCLCIDLHFTAITLACRAGFDLRTIFDGYSRCGNLNRPAITKA